MIFSLGRTYFLLVRVFNHSTMKWFFPGHFDLVGLHQLVKWPQQQKHNSTILWSSTVVHSLGSMGLVLALCGWLPIPCLLSHATQPPSSLLCFSTHTPTSHCTVTCITWKMHQFIMMSPYCIYGVVLPLLWSFYQLMKTHEVETSWNDCFIVLRLKALTVFYVTMSLYNIILFSY